MRVTWQKVHGMLYIVMRGVVWCTARGLQQNWQECLGLK